MTVILKIRFYICPCLRMKKNKTMKKNCFLLLFLLCACLVQAQDTYRTDKDVPYISGSETDAYRLERCKLDVYYPENKKDFSTIVWFHGGGMEGGSKFVPRELTDQGFAVVAVNYRLSPKESGLYRRCRRSRGMDIPEYRKVWRSQGSYLCFRSFGRRLPYVDSGNG